MSIIADVVLVGGSGPNEGYLYATNPVTKIYGPVCDDAFSTNGVRKRSSSQSSYIINN